MSRICQLEFLQGERKGERVTISPMCYRVFVRAEDSSSTTLQMTSQGDRIIDENSDRLLHRHIAEHSPHSESPSKAQQDRVRPQIRQRDIVLHDANISRSHAMLFHNGEGLSLADLMSTNGCFVNGQPVSDVDLYDGDELRLGQTRFKVLVTTENSAKKTD